LKFLPARRAGLALALTLAIPAAFLAIASLPWRDAPPVSPPRVVRVARGAGGLTAGAGEARFSLPADTPIGGFARLSYASSGVAGPVGVRALVLSAPGCTVAVASLELLLVPEDLRADVAVGLADLRLDGLLLAATHTHAGPGGYWRNPVGQRAATGSFDPHVRAAIVRATVDAVHRAADALGPARVAVARGVAGDLARSRSGGLEDAPVTALRIERPDGAPVAEVAVFAAHPTLLGKRNRTISGDWAGLFLAGGSHGLRLFLQGAVGDQSARGPASGSPDLFAAAVSARVDALLAAPGDPAPALAWAEVETGLPSVDPHAAPALLRPAARSLLGGMLPQTARVVALRVGPAVLVAVPAEPVAGVAAGWRAGLPDATVVSLADGYLGYVESPERMAQGAGEDVRTEFGPDLAAVLGAAVKAAYAEVSADDDASRLRARGGAGDGPGHATGR
jgi:hypothetical protein